MHAHTQSHGHRYVGFVYIIYNIPNDGSLEVEPHLRDPLAHVRLFEGHFQYVALQVRHTLHTEWTHKFYRKSWRISADRRGIHIVRLQLPEMR